jgi:uncharacterized protein CbrC (UPF0167 family)
MRTNRIAAFAVAVVLATPAVGAAQTLGQLQWVGTGSSFVATFNEYGGGTETGYAGAAYRANALLPASAPWYLQASNGFGPAVDIYCIDFLHAAWTTTYPAYFTNLALDDLTKTRSTNLTKYRQVAWLTTQMDLEAFTSAGRRDRVDIHAAIWRILSGQPRSATYSGSPYAASESRVSSWVALATTASNYNNVNISEYTVVTSKCVDDYNQEGRGHGYTGSPQCGQEFLIRRRVTVTPEGSTILLMASGLLAMAGSGLVFRRGGAA